MTSRFALAFAIWPAAACAFSRHPAAQRAGAELSEPADHMVVPFRAGRTDRCAGALAAAMLQEKIGQSVVIENKTGGSGVVGAAFAARADTGRLHAARQFARRYAEPALPAGDLQPGGRFRADRLDRRWAAAGARHRRQLPYKTLAELIADAKANPKKFSIGTSGPASSPGLTLCRSTRRKPDRRRCPIAGRARRRARWRRRHPGRVHVLFAGQAAGGRRQGRAHRRRGAEANPGLAGRADDSGTGLQDHRPRLRRSRRARQDTEADRPVVQQAPQRGGADGCVQAEMAELGMAPPPASDNTPEKFDAYHARGDRAAGRSRRAVGAEDQAAAEVSAYNRVERNNGESNPS